MLLCFKQRICYERPIKLKHCRWHTYNRGSFVGELFIPCVRVTSLCLPWRLWLQSCGGWRWRQAGSSSLAGRLCKAAGRLVVLHTTPHLWTGWTWGSNIQSGSNQYRRWEFPTSMCDQWFHLSDGDVSLYPLYFTLDAAFLCSGPRTAPSIVAPSLLPALNKHKLDITLRVCLIYLQILRSNTEQFSLTGLQKSRSR